MHDPNLALTASFAPSSTPFTTSAHPTTMSWDPPFAACTDACTDAYPNGIGYSAWTGPPLRQYTSATSTINPFSLWTETDPTSPPLPEAYRSSLIPVYPPMFPPPPRSCCSSSSPQACLSSSHRHTHSGSGAGNAPFLDAKAQGDWLGGDYGPVRESSVGLTTARNPHSYPNENQNQNQKWDLFQGEMQDRLAVAEEPLYDFEAFVEFKSEEDDDDDNNDDDNDDEDDTESGSTSSQDQEQDPEMIEALAQVARVRKRGTKSTLENAQYRCPFCAKLFRRTYNFKCHLTTHETHRTQPHVCGAPGCQRKFVRKSDLNRHEQTVSFVANHPRLFFLCFCGGRLNMRVCTGFLSRTLFI